VIDIYTEAKTKLGPIPGSTTARAVPGGGRPGAPSIVPFGGPPTGRPQPARQSNPGRQSITSAMLSQALTAAQGNPGSAQTGSTEQSLGMMTGLTRFF